MTKRLVPLSGVTFVLLVIAAVVIVGGSPGSGAPAAEVAAFYDEHSLRQFVAPFVFAASVPFLVLFATGVAATSSTNGAGRSVWPQMLIAGSVLIGAVVLGMAGVHLALQDASEQGVSPAALQAINVLDGNSWGAFHAGFGVMMVGAAGSLLSRRGLYGWLGRIALVLGIALFVPVADFFALLLTAVWIVVTSVAMFRDGRAARYAGAPAHGVAG